MLSTSIIKFSSMVFTSSIPGAGHDSNDSNIYCEIFKGKQQVAQQVWNYISIAK